MTELLEKLDPMPISTGEEDVRQFLSEIRRYPLLSAEEELALARRCAEGDEEAVRQMVPPICGWWYPWPGSMRAVACHCWT